MCTIENNACGKREFSFHFNRDKSETSGENEVLIHCDGVSESVKNVICNVPTKGKFNIDTPKFVMTGCCDRIVIRDGIAYVD